MRIGLCSTFLLALLWAPAGAQTCKKAPPPFLPDLFPKAVSGLPLEFSTAPGSGCMGLYRPAEQAPRLSEPWASVTVDAEPDTSLGETAESVRARFGASGAEILLVGDWPVAFTVRSIGDEFLTVRGSVRIKVLVKNGDQGEVSKALATAILERMLQGIPCA